MRAAGLSLSFTLALAAAAAPVRADVDKKASRTALDDCARKFSQRDVAGAITSCKAATAAWDGNHRAWYVLGLAQGQGEFRESAASLAKAVALYPDEAMYQLWAGVIGFEAASQTAVEAAAAQQGVSAAEVSPSEVTFDTSAVKGYLQRAVDLNGDLWRAQFYLGRVHRMEGDDKAAAQAFTRAIAAHADYAPTYAALASLYQRWGYVREAVQVATAGTKHVTLASDRAQLWLQLGVIQADAGADDAAIAAYDKALADQKDFADALLQRGAAYYRKKDFPKAKADLEAALANGNIAPIQKRVANRILLEIAERSK
jgi:tetratricopeptide (TPR) repeat protein